MRPSRWYRHSFQGKKDQFKNNSKSQKHKTLEPHHQGLQGYFAITANQSLGGHLKMASHNLMPGIPSLFHNEVKFGHHWKMI